MDVEDGVHEMEEDDDDDDDDDDEDDDEDEEEEVEGEEQSLWPAPRSSPNVFSPQIFDPSQREKRRKMAADTLPATSSHEDHKAAAELRAYVAMLEFKLHDAKQKLQRAHPGVDQVRESVLLRAHDIHTQHKTLTYTCTHTHTRMLVRAHDVHTQHITLTYMFTHTHTRTHTQKHTCNTQTHTHTHVGTHNTRALHQLCDTVRMLGSMTHPF